MAREHAQNDRNDPRGKTVPRESDNEALADYAERMERGEVGTNARRN